MPGRRKQPGSDADALAGLVESLAVLLDAGLTPRSAWQVSAADGVHPIAVAVVRSAQLQTSCAQALLEEADTDEVLAIAAAWQVAEQSGAPLGHALRTVAETLREVAEAERETDVALSGPRATARLVSWLPLAGAAMSVALGADLVRAVASAPGLIAVGGGALLMLCGRLWMQSLVKRALVRSAMAGSAEELIAIGLAGGASAGAALDASRRATAAVGLPPLDDRAAQRVLRLAASAGAPAAELLTAAARQQRRVARADARRAATTLGVRLMLPLGACVLPSFLLLAVAPLVLSLLSSTTAVFR